MSSDISSAPIIRRRIPTSQRRRDGLIQYANDITSQNGEDGIIGKIFNDILPHPKHADERQYCVDVGSWDGRHLSNTFSLLVAPNENRIHDNSDEPLVSSCCFSWKGILLEADPERFLELKALHEPLGNICINKNVSSDPTSKDSLVSILRHEAAELPNDFDFLCIDVDGLDYWLLREIFDDCYRPKVICIEFNPSMPNDLIYIPARNDAMRHGCSLAALVELAESHDYVLIETTLYNGFFCPKELYQKYFKCHVPDISIEALHETTMGTGLYQLFDGTLKLWGCKKLLWHRIKLDETRMQMIPSSQRIFPFAPNSCSLDAVTNNSVIDMSAYCQPNSLKISFPYQPTRCSDSRDININVKEKTTQQPASRNDDDSKIVCSKSLLDRLKSDGFALVRGTGISGQLCREALRVSHSFLHEADESVRRSCMSKRDRARRGYSPLNTENFASLIGELGHNDLVRKFRMGPPSIHTTSHQQQCSETKNSSTVTSLPLLSNGTSSLLQENVWPSPSISAGWDAVDSEDFQSTLESYYDKVCYAANKIVQAICEGLILEYPELGPSLEVLSSSSPIMTQAHDEENNENSNLINCSGNSSAPNTSTSILTLLGYRTGSRHKKAHQKKKREVRPLVAAHTDVGVITVLLYDGGDCAVLQRQLHKNDNQFENVVLPSQVEDDPIFVINIANCLSALTGKRLPSTVHRVMPHEGTVPRNCLALFVGLNGDEKLNIDGEVISYETWRKKRIEESQSVLRSSK